MNVRQRPLAVALLEWFVPDNEPLVGDLLEASEERSRAWLWRQVVLAIAARVTLRTALVTFVMLSLLGFHAVVVASLIDHLLVLNDTSWIGVTGQYRSWQLPSMLPSFIIAVLIGRGIGRVHGEHRITAVLAFSASATLAAFLNLYLFIPHAPVQPLVPYAARQTVVAMLFVAGLFVGISSSPGSSERAWR